MIKVIKKFTTNNNKITRNDLKFYFLFYKKFYLKKKRARHCFKTKRARGFYKFFNLSRHSIKEFAKKEYLPGVIKSSW